jgi:hypothetical protein
MQDMTGLHLLMDGLINGERLIDDEVMILYGTLIQQLGIANMNMKLLQGTLKNENYSSWLYI